MSRRPLRRPIPARRASSPVSPDVGPISSRGMQTPEIPGAISAPGIPEGTPLPAFQFFTPDQMTTIKAFTPDQASGLCTIIEKGLQNAFDRYSIYTQSKPFDNYDIQLAHLTANAQIRLDRFAQQGQIARRALLIINTSAADVLWVGKSNVNIGQGIPVGVDNSTYLVSIHERSEHYGIIAHDTTIVVVWYS